ncbi:hypothetical protein MKW98_002689 [Papaver atlanticum]|uniref:EF-hand domain-containing protein n=1 Tax=Papaver atlanticum TaxID=357466 RepID=A0AAD4SCM2_9MAGN|nr:hypothetical protein MKW98_002689 [Papaver atlanticum]
MKHKDVIERVFFYLDEDGDGMISLVELRRYIAAVRGEMVEVDEIVKLLDIDGDGCLGLDDFVKLMDGSEEEEKMVIELKQAFEMYLMDGYECITPKSLRKMLNQLGESKSIEECRVMISQFDLNGDGELNFDEFKVMML